MPKVKKDIISKIEFIRDSNLLKIFTTDGFVRTFKDDALCCCEERYLSLNEDDLDYFIGAQYLSYDVSDYKAEKDPDGLEAHDSMFLNIRTTKGVFTVVTHNEHNGWYGGFDVVMEYTPTNPKGKELLDKINKKRR